MSLFGLGVLVLGVALRVWTGTDEVAPLRWTLRGALVGVAASLPTLSLLAFLLRSPFPPFRRMVRLVEETIAPLMRRAGVPGVVLVSVLAGLGEELLFRGWLQVQLERWGTGTAAAVVAASAAFGVLHWITAWYALIAGLIGLYYGLLLLLTGDLLIPVTAHFVHDLVALGLLLRRDRRRTE